MIIRKLFLLAFFMNFFIKGQLNLIKNLNGHLFLAINFLLLDIITKQAFHEVKRISDNAESEQNGTYKNKND